MQLGESSCTLNICMLQVLLRTSHFEQRLNRFIAPPAHSPLRPPKELRALLHALEDYRLGYQSLICPDSLLVIKRVLG